MATAMARSAGLILMRFELRFLTETQIAYFLLTPGLSSVYVAIETPNCFNNFNLQESR